MEKQRSKSESKSGRRLLVLLVISLFLSSLLNAQSLSASAFNQLKITPSEQQSLYTKTDLKFEVSIPEIKPSQIQILSQTLSSDITFRSMRKIEDYENGGTIIELWYNFEKKGTYQLPSLPLLIQNKQRYIPFEKVTITEDPSRQSPQIVLVFSNGEQLSTADELTSSPAFSFPVGKKLTFTVHLQYSNQLVQFSWDIPKDSIFTQTETYEFAEVRYREKKFSHDLIPVASFEWTALTTGSQNIPKIKITATDYDGYRKELILPAFTINFTESSDQAQTLEDQMFAASFIQQNNSLNSKQFGEITEDDCKKLAQLYINERNSLFDYKANLQERMDFEASLGLPVTASSEFPAGIIYIYAILFTIFMILLIIMIKKKKTIFVFLFTIILICVTVPFFYTVIKHKTTYGISKNCTIYSIPEEKAEAVSEIGAGNRVKITEQTEKWLFIELGYTGGWVLKDNIIIIQ